MSANDIAPPPPTMNAVLLTGHGGFDRLAYRGGVRTPIPAAHEVLIRVGGAGVNNTDINMRVGWYSKSAAKGSPESAAQDSGWTGEVDGQWTTYIARKRSVVI